MPETAVETEAKLVKKQLRMARANAVIGAVEEGFEVGNDDVEPFQMVGIFNGIEVFGHVDVALFSQLAVNRKAVACDGRSQFDVLFGERGDAISVPQAIVDSAPEAENYCPDGWFGHLDMAYPGNYIRNCRDKSDTSTVEWINADLRTYIPVLRHRSRCFCHKIETLRAVIEVFVDAYNKFGEAKAKFRQGRDPKSRELPFSVFDFLQSTHLATPKEIFCLHSLRAFVIIEKSVWREAALSFQNIDRRLTI
jgi:hypothetical protein